jgi:hypothetical protein
VAITARNPEEIGRLIPHIAAALKMPEEKVREQLKVSTAKGVERRPDTVHFSLSFGGPDAIRSAAKACLVLWSTVVGNDEVRSSAYLSAREFVLNGSENFCQSRTHLDARAFESSDIIKAKFGPLYNAIYVASDASGKVIGHFTLYNVISFQIVLADRGGSPNKKVGLVSNPLSPSDWTDSAAEEFDVPFTWLETPEYSVDRSRNRVNDLMRAYVDASRTSELHRIADTVFDKHGLGENDPIPPDLLKKIIHEISTRVAAHMLSLPYEQSVDVEALVEPKK